MPLSDRSSQLARELNAHKATSRVIVTIVGPNTLHATFEIKSGHGDFLNGIRRRFHEQYGITVTFSARS